MHKWWKLAVGSVLAASLLTAGCGTQSADTGSKKLKVMTTFYPMYEFSKQVAGDLADVSVLVPAGTEPHDWEPTPKDVAQIATANVFVYNGAGFESWVDDVLKSADAQKTKVVEASKGIELIEGTDEHKALDPHVWLDPVLAQKEVQTIADSLAAADPAHAADYKKNADTYIGKLQVLDTTFKSGLSNAKHRDFVTSHTAFSYLAKRYDLTQEPISGISPEQEPSASEMKGIVEFAKQHQVKTIFFETLVSPKVAEAVAREIGAETDVLNPLEGLTEEERTSGLDYVGVMKKNLEALQKALAK
ncbi:MAG: metal ABC transporter substrate-binding protein [Tumebacillaceae bacterium]